MVKVKICGITRMADAQLAVDLGAAALGFNFYKKSPRYIAPSQAKKIIERLPPFVTPVGIFVNEKKDKILRIVRQCGLTTLQLHGDETPPFCASLKGYKTIKAFRVGPEFKIGAVKKYKTHGYLFDAYSKDQFGGTGVRFNWQVLKGRSFSRPVILSGGLNSSNIQAAVATVKPYAVDLASGVESSPGKKDARLLTQLFKAIGP